MTDMIDPKRWQKLAGLMTESVNLVEGVDMAKVMKQAEFIKSSPMMTPRAWNQVLMDIQGMIQGDEDPWGLREKAYKDWSDEELQALLDELGPEREVSGKSIWGPGKRGPYGEAKEGSDKDKKKDKKDKKDKDDWDAVEASKWHGPAGSHLGPPKSYKSGRRRHESSCSQNESFEINPRDIEQLLESYTKKKGY